MSKFFVCSKELPRVIYVTDQHTLEIVGRLLIDGFTTLLLTDVSLSLMVVVTRMETTFELKQNVPNNVKVSFKQFHSCTVQVFEDF